MTLKDKIVILTGASSGIGRATAILLAKEETKTILSDIQDEEGLKTLKMVKEEGGEASYIHCDVAKTEEVKEMINFTLDKYGRVDILINNAGVVRVGPMEIFSDEDYELLINVNLKGTYFCCKHVIPHLKKQKSGVIINLASVAAHIGQVAHANYCSTKAGILGMTRGLALDLAPFNVRVNTVSPGATYTPMLIGDITKNAKERGVDFDVVKKEFEAEGVMGRMADPMEIAKGILFLADDEKSSYMTGADLRLDGGWTTR